MIFIDIYSALNKVVEEAEWHTPKTKFVWDQLGSRSSNMYETCHSLFGYTK